jgi:hypothetical protein
MDIAELQRHAAHLTQVWEFYVDKASVPPNRQWGRWLEWNPADRIEEAIKSLGKRLGKPEPMQGGAEGLHRYVTAALIGMRKKAGEPPRAWEPLSSSFEAAPRAAPVSTPAPHQRAITSEFFKDWKAEAETYAVNRDEDGL